MRGTDVTPFRRARRAGAALAGALVAIVAIGWLMGEIFRADVPGVSLVRRLDERFANLAPPRTLGGSWEWLTDWGSFGRTWWLVPILAFEVAVVTWRAMSGLCVALAWAGAVVITVATKKLVGDLAGLPADSVSFQPFPSGHALLSLALYGMVGVQVAMAPWRIRRGALAWPLRVLGAVAGLAAVGFAVWIGCVRVWTRAHLASEVVGAWVLAVLWVAAIVGVTSDRFLRPPTQDARTMALSPSSGNAA